MKELPRGLRREIRSHIFREMVENWEALKDESPGTVDVVVQMLRIVVYPKQEFVLTAGEMSDEMFFIVKGVVELKNRNHVSVAIL